MLRGDQQGECMICCAKFLSFKVQVSRRLYIYSCSQYSIKESLHTLPRKAADELALTRLSGNPNGACGEREFPRKYGVCADRRPYSFGKWRTKVWGEDYRFGRRFRALIVGIQTSHD